MTGFLGAGKTTAINQLLAQADGRRIAAVVNDFGAINIDAELIAGATDGVVSLANGCICCTLEGDLLRTLATLLRRDPRPEAVVIETSGIADPADIVRNLMDPVIWREAPLETVLCLVDASSMAMADDALFRSQVAAADLLALTKTDEAAPATAAAVQAAIRRLNTRATIVAADHGALPLALLFPADPDRPRPDRTAGKRRPVADRFETLSWTGDRPLSLPRFQAAIGRLAPKLARAKGVFAPADAPDRPLLLQLACGRATLSPAPPGPAGAPAVRLVFIAEVGVLTAAELDAVLTPCLAP